MTQKYDAIVIGAGMSGLACAIRLSMFEKKVLLLEKHTISGGLNSYYRRRSPVTKEFIEYDSGLHAMTNFVKKGERGKPLTKLLKQLRLSHDDLLLKEQTYSKILFGNHELSFSNDFNKFKENLLLKFPSEAEGLEKLFSYINGYNELDLTLPYLSTKEVLDKFLFDKLLKEMILAPLLIYGSAHENDMDFTQFVIMFKSIYLEGFARPVGGVRTILRLLLNKYKDLGGELRFRAGVREILTEDGVASGVILENGEKIYSDLIFSSMGYPETVNILSDKSFYEIKPKVGPMSFMETIFVFDKKIPLGQNDATIIFYNEDETYRYECPRDYFDSRSAVICFPDNYEKENREGHGIVRVTFMANYDLFSNLPKDQYIEKKKEAFREAYKLVKKILPNFDGNFIASDVFSPTTIKRYTFHEKGTVYGSTDKTRDGRTKIKGLYIIGTDQGFLGIVGAMLSGISMANLYGLMGENA